MKPLKTFNNVILGQFVLTGIPIKVYVDGVYYTITSPDDLEDSIYGFGMDEDGRMHEFDYRRIEHLLVNDNVITLDVYNDAMQKEFGGGDDAAEEKPKEEKPADDKEAKDDVKEEGFLKEKSPCWDGYRQVGMKKKGGKMGPNCVPIKEDVMPTMKDLLNEISKEEAKAKKADIKA